MDTPEDAAAAADKIGGDMWVVKAQVHAGGRGKAGGVKLVKSKAEIEAFAKQWLGMMAPANWLPTTRPKEYSGPMRLPSPTLPQAGSRSNFPGRFGAGRIGVLFSALVPVQ